MRIHVLIAAQFVAKAELRFQEYLFLSTATVLESWWSAFHATGDIKYIRRVLDVAQNWAEFSYLPDSSDYLVDPQKKLPDEIMVRAWRGLVG